MRREWIWWIIFGVVGILAVGLMTDFQFDKLEIQQHDTYYVLDSLIAIFFIAVILGTIRCSLLIVDLITDRYKILAILISIVNPVIGLFIIFLIYFSVQRLIFFKTTYPDINLFNEVVPLVFLAGLIVLQVVIEIRTIRKIKGRLNE